MPLTITVKHPVYNDGVIKYYKVTPEYNSSRKKTGNKKEYIGKLNYAIVSMRQQDYDFAESKSKKLDMKVKTPKKTFDTEYLVQLNEEYYECYLCDDSDKYSNYLYLQKVKI